MKLKQIVILIIFSLAINQCPDELVEDHCGDCWQAYCYCLSDHIPNFEISQNECEENSCWWIGVGGAYEELAGRQMQDQIARYNEGDTYSTPDLMQEYFILQKQMPLPLPTSLMEMVIVWPSVDILLEHVKYYKIYLT